jgi:hypothetical protein
MEPHEEAPAQLAGTAESQKFPGGGGRARSTCTWQDWRSTNTTYFLSIITLFANRRPPFFFLANPERFKFPDLQRLCQWSITMASLGCDRLQTRHEPVDEAANSARNGGSAPMHQCTCQWRISKSPSRGVQHCALQYFFHFNVGLCCCWGRHLEGRWGDGRCVMGRH